MLTLDAAAHLLLPPRDAVGLTPLAAALGFGEPAPFDEVARDALGLASGDATCLVARGPGALRALLVELPPDRPLRDAVRALAARLTSRTPHLLWVLIGVQPGSAQLTIAAWSPDKRDPRVAALVGTPGRATESDAETLRLLVASRGDDTLTHARWLEILGRESLTRRFFRTLERVTRSLGDAGDGAPPAERREQALLYVSRLIFLSFLETRGWLDGDLAFLSRGFDGCLASGGSYQRRVLAPLFFGTLNTPPDKRSPRALALGRLPFLNGGLFSRSALERRHPVSFPDEALGDVFGELLGHHRFVGRETESGWIESAVDPEMLGKAFESLMASEDRRGSGAFFTPQAIVEAVTCAALADALSPGRHAGGPIPTAVVLDALDGRRIDAPEATVLRSRLASLRVLDPACGSGAFLVHVLERLAALARVAGDRRDVATVRREVLTRSVFGVDVNPTAVWLCELRLWLSVVIEDPTDDPLRLPALPNLDRHVRVGDALADGPRPFVTRPHAHLSELARVRTRYARATGSRKQSLSRTLDMLERKHALTLCDEGIARASHARREMLVAARSHDLFGGRRGNGDGERARLVSLRAELRELRVARQRLQRGGALPFAFATHFADASEAGGFDIVLGNPPWVRPHHVAARTRLALRRQFAVARAKRWHAESLPVPRSSGFAMQVDLAAPFIERAVELLRPGGTLAFLLPVKLWRSLAGSGLRRLLAERTELRAIADWSRSVHTFDAAVYPSMLVARHRLSADAEGEPITIIAERRCRTQTWSATAGELTVDAAAGSPWLLAPPDVVAAFRQLAHAGTPLGARAAPLLGVKCGCNDAFLVERHGVDGELALVSARGRKGRVESAMLRPALRGDGIVPFAAHRARWIVWTHEDSGAPLARLPPHAARWLAAMRPRLDARTDARRTARWWALFRVEGARTDQPRVVWSDIGQTPRAVVLRAGDDTVPLNSCYVLRMPSDADAHAMAALLASPIAGAWLALIAEPARGAYHRYLAWTMSLLPLPHDWEHARALLAPLGQRGAHGDVAPSPAELLEVALRAYRLREDDVAAMLAWNAR